MGITWNWTGTTLQIEPLYFSCGGTAHLLTPDLSRPPGFWSGLPFMHYLFSLEFFFLSSSKKNQLSCQFWQLKEKNIGIIHTWPQSTILIPGTQNQTDKWPGKLMTLHKQIIQNH